MKLLAQLRASGASVELDGDGLRIRQAPAALVERARAAKVQLTAALRTERLAGEQYENSALWWRLEQFYLAVKGYELTGSPAEDCAALKAIIWRVDDAALTSFSAIETVLSEVREEAIALAERLDAARGALFEGPLLEGKDLAGALLGTIEGATVFVPTLRPVARKANRGAFAG